MTLADILGLDRFTDLLAWLPLDLSNFIVAVLVILLILAFRRVLY